MSDEPDERADSRPSRPVTSMSLRAERLRLNLNRAAGAKTDGAPGLSTPKPPRDPELVNRFAIAGFVAGVVALFVDFFVIPTVVALVLCGLGLVRARRLDARGKGPYGRRRSLWGIGFALFGALGIAFQLFIRPLL